MARYKPVERGQGYFLTIYPDAIFEDHSIEKVIDKFIDDFVDINLFNWKYKNDNLGQKAISPLVKLKVIIYGLSQGIESIRRIEKMMSLNHPGYLFLSGGSIIDHSTLCYFINDFFKEIVNIFGRLICLLNDLNLIDWRKIMIDGTLISSNASKEFTKDSIGFKEKLKHYENLSMKLLERAKYVSEQRESGEIDSHEEKEEKRKIEKQQKKYNQFIEKVKLYEEEVKAKKVCPDKKINLTDQSSSLLSKGETFLQGYNIQSAYCSNDILLLIDPARNGDDKSCLSPMVGKVERVKENLSVKDESDYLLDKGYFNTSEIPKLKQEGKKLYVATPSNFTGHWFIKGEHDFVSEDDGVYFICKGKKKKKGNFKKAKNNYEFTLRRSFCEGCEYFPSCWKGKKEDSKERSFTIALNYVENKQLWLDYHKETKSKEWKHIYNKRIGKEHNFYDLKSNTGLSRLNFRGSLKIKTISLLAGIAYNLKKLQKATADIGWNGIKIALDEVQ